MQNANPALRTFSAVTQGLEGDPSVQMQQQEQVPGWLRLIPSGFPGVQKDPGSGEKTVNRYFTEIVRTTFPQIGLFERIVPGFGNERHPGRWFTAIVSTTLGLPVNTIDPWIRASEQQRRTEMVKEQLKYMYGSESSEYRIGMIRSLMDAGAPTEFIEMLDINSMEDNEVDVGQALGVWEMWQRVAYLTASGVPQEEIAAALSSFIDADSPLNEWVNELYDNMNVSDSDRNRLLRRFDRRKVLPEDLERLGINQRQLRDMSDDELRMLIELVNGLPF